MAASSLQKLGINVFSRSRKLWHCLLPPKGRVMIIQFWWNIYIKENVEN